LLGVVSLLAERPIFELVRPRGQRAKNHYPRGSIRAKVAAIDGRALTFDGKQTQVINLFYALWRARTEIRDNPGEDAALRGILPGRGWSKDEEEGLEEAGFVFQRGATIPARFMNGLDVQRQVDRYLIENPSASWGVVRASGGEFVVPDWPVLAFIPINPTLALAASALNQTLDRDAVRLVNKQLRLGSRRYFFARDFTACP
jgi:hypothetical protein